MTDKDIPTYGMKYERISGSPVYYNVDTFNIFIPDELKEELNLTLNRGN